jgi:MFS family permease
LLGLQVVMGLLVIIFSLTHIWLVNCALMFISGMTFMAMFSIGFSIVQLAIPDELRGRVISIYMVALRSGGPLGGLVTGAFADWFTAPRALMINGAVLALISAGVLFSGRGKSLQDH